MLDVHDVIAFLEFGEVDVQGGTRGDGVRGLHAPGPLEFVAPEDLGIGDDHAGAFGEEETSAQRPQMCLQPGAAFPLSHPMGEGRGEGLSLSRPLGEGWGEGVPQPILIPNLSEPLPFALVVAEDVDGAACAQPAVQLSKELASLGLGDMGLRRSLAEGTEQV